MILPNIFFNDNSKTLTENEVFSQTIVKNFMFNIKFDFSIIIDIFRGDTDLPISNNILTPVFVDDVSF